MKTLERIAISLGLFFVGIAAIYRYVLTDEQRETLVEAATAVQSATREVTDMVSPLVSDGPTRSEEEALAEANRERTAKQWEALGF
ncbi:MAG: hypothetical protein J6S63_05830 [Atopobiaceae bacterium]|nr:hypothetical protein [Atopobiaceae bacterium]